jgi:hypothetical protein
MKGRKKTNYRPDNLIEKYERDMKLYKVSGVAILIFFSVIAIFPFIMFEGRVWYLFFVPLLLGLIYYLVSLLVVKKFKNEIARLKNIRRNKNEITKNF